MPGRDGLVYLVRAGEDDLVVRDARPADRELLRRLERGPASAEALREALGLPRDEIDAMLGALVAAGAVVPAAASAALDPVDAERYARQLPYLGDVGDERDLQRRLAAARVTVIGCGGLGTWTLAALAAAGVRRLRIVDDDRVELSNLNRQVLYTPADIGTPKVQAVAAWLRAFDDRVEVDARAERVGSETAALEVVRGSDALVLAADTPPYELARWVNRACVRERVPFLLAGQLPPIVKAGPLYRPGLTGCFNCHERALRQESQDYDAYVLHAARVPSRAATLGPASALIGAVLAMELVHLLIGVEPASAGAALLVDLRTLGIRRAVVARDPDCPECQHLMSDT